MGYEIRAWLGKVLVRAWQVTALVSRLLWEGWATLNSLRNELFWGEFLLHILGSLIFKSFALPFAPKEAALRWAIRAWSVLEWVLSHALMCIGLTDILFKSFLHKRYALIDSFLVVTVEIERRALCWRLGKLSKIASSLQLAFILERLCLETLVKHLEGSLIAVSHLLTL